MLQWEEGRSLIVRRHAAGELEIALFLDQRGDGVDVICWVELRDTIKGHRRSDVPGTCLEEFCGLPAEPVVLKMVWKETASVGRSPLLGMPLAFYGAGNLGHVMHANLN